MPINIPGTCPTLATCGLDVLYKNINSDKTTPDTIPISTPKHKVTMIVEIMAIPSAEEYEKTLITDLKSTSDKTAIIIVAAKVAFGK